MPREFGDQLRQAIPGARLLVAERSGHMPHEETPEPVRRAIEDLLAALGSGGLLGTLNDPYSPATARETGFNDLK